MAAASNLPCFSQKQGQELIDSLEAELPKMKEDSNKAKALNRIAQTYEWVNPLKCFPYAERGLQLAEKVKWNADANHGTAEPRVGLKFNMSLKKGRNIKSVSWENLKGAIELPEDILSVIKIVNRISPDDFKIY